MTNNDTLQAYNSMSEEGRMNKLTTLQKLLKESTAGIWEVQFISGLVPHRREIVVQRNSDNPIIKDLAIPEAMFIAEAHNSLPDILKALEIAMDALRYYAKGENIEENFDQEDKSKSLITIVDDGETSRKALQEITKLLND